MSSATQIKPFPGNNDPRVQSTASSTGFRSCKITGTMKAPRRLSQSTLSPWPVRRNLPWLISHQTPAWCNSTAAKARNLGFDARHELDPKHPENPAHALVYTALMGNG